MSRLRDATSKLFEEGVDIATLIDAAAQRQIAEGAVDREILEVLKPKLQAESDYDAVSPLSLELYAHARIFECAAIPDFNRFGPVVGRKLKLAKQWISDDTLVTLLLTVDHEPPNWATSDVLVNVRHDAFLLAYNATTRLCFIGSTRRTDRLYIDLMQTFVLTSIGQSALNPRGALRLVWAIFASTMSGSKTPPSTRRPNPIVFSLDQERSGPLPQATLARLFKAISSEAGRTATFARQLERAAVRAFGVTSG
jgi:hypothetical protein